MRAALSRSPLLVLAIACSATEPPAQEPAPTQLPSAGGIRLVYQLGSPESVAETDPEQALERAEAIVRERVASVTAHASVRRDHQQIVVELGQASAPLVERVRGLLERQGRLGFHIVSDGTPFMEELCESVRSDSKAGVMRIEAALDVWTGPDGAHHRDCYLSAEDRTGMLDAEEAAAEGCRVPDDVERAPCVISGRRILERYLADRKDLTIDATHEIGFEHGESTAIGGQPGERYWRTYYQERTSQLSGSMIVSASVARSDFDTSPLVRIELDAEGKERLAAFTAAHLGRKLSIVVDGTIRSAPIIQSAITGGSLLLLPGVGSPAAQEREAQELALTLPGGALPAPLALIASEEYP